MRILEKGNKVKGLPAGCGRDENVSTASTLKINPQFWEKKEGQQVLEDTTTQGGGEKEGEEGI